MDDISPSDLRDLLANEPVVVIDVREPWEFALCQILGSELVPLESLPDHLAELDPELLTVMVCHHGVRSHYAAEYLRSNGFQRVLNLAGGIHRWAVELDPTMAQY